MRIIAFIVGFLVIVYGLVPHIAAHDPEPGGAEASLYLFSLLPLTAGVAVFAWLTRFGTIRFEAVCGLATGALTSGVFYLTLNALFPLVSLGLASLGALAMCISASTAAARLISAAGCGK